MANRGSAAAMLLRAREEHAAMVRRSAAAGSGSPASWLPMGPLQVNTAAWSLVTGRVTSIAADSADRSGNTVYLGTAGGGVWKSTNAAGAVQNVSFTPLTDDLGAFSSAAISSLSIGAVSVQPGGTGVVLAGTGDPNDATDSWYGAGILRSSDGGNSWSLLTGTARTGGSAGYTYSFLGNAIAGFAWSTDIPNLVVAAVSESGYGQIAGVSGSASIPGMFYSQDSGMTWQMATLQDGATVIQSAQAQVLQGNPATAVAWNPVRHRFYAAIRAHGYYESADGITWSRLDGQPGTGMTAANCPPRAGLTGSPSCPVFRGAIAVQTQTGDMFALTVDQNNRNQGLWQDTCALSSGACTSGAIRFGTRIADGALEAASQDGTIDNGRYNLWLAAVPAQQDTLLFAGTTDIWRCSLANDCVWRNTTNTQTCGASQVAPAQHAVEGAFAAAGLMYFGNDGGLWRTTDAVSQTSPPCSPDDAAHFQNLNGSLGSLAEVDSFSQDPSNPSIWLTALGPLGTAATAQDTAEWPQVLNGEGDLAAIDPVNPQNWYATSQYGIGVNRCTQGSSCSIAGFGSVAVGPAQAGNDLQLIPAAWILDPANTGNLLLGTCRIWRGPANGEGWSQGNLLSGMLDGNQGSFCNGNAEVRSVAAGLIYGGSSNTPVGERIYAGMAGPLDGGFLKPGHVFAARVNDDSDPSKTVWSDLYYSPVTNAGGMAQFNPNGMDVSSLYPDPHDTTGQTVYVTIQGYSSASSGQPLVYRSTDGGAHWSDITSNLPRAPANAVTVDPVDASVVYVALDTGVYVTQNVDGCAVAGAVCWNVFGSGLPNAPVTGLETFSQNTTQLLRASTWGRGLWQTSLATASRILTTVTLSPSSLSFAAQQVQLPGAPQPIRVTNTGTTGLLIDAITMPSDFTETDTCTGQTVAPQDSCQVEVTFAPSAAGSFSETMRLHANVAGGDLSVSLSGTGLPPGVVVLTPSSLNFGAVAAGNRTDPQFVTIANTGSATLALGTETVSGDFSLTSNTCGNSLGGAKSCTVGIVFSPTKTGSRTGVLTVTDAAGTQVAQLSGTGQSVATDLLSAPSLAFAAQQVGTVSVAQLVSLTNRGDQALTGISVSVSGDFSLVNNCGTLLQGHGSCYLSVSYVPTRTGLQTGVLTVSDVLGRQTVSLSGTGVAPPGISADPISLSFGALAVGSSAVPQVVTLTNSGGIAITNLTTAITQPFLLSGSNCQAALGPGEFCQVRVSFRPVSAGAQNGTLTFNAANLPRPLSIALSGDGADFTIAVSGSSTAVLTSGQTASFTLQLAGVSNTPETVALACTGVPQNSICSLNPASIAVTGLNTSSAAITIATGVSTSAALQGMPDWRLQLPLLAILLPISWRFRRSAKGTLLMVLLAAMVTTMGCGVSASSGGGGSGGGSGTGGSGGSKTPTPSGTYVITVTGTMATITHTTTVKLTVQ